MAREYPEHPLPSCHALVRRGDQFVLVQRARPPFAGYWSLPGGGVELGETVQQALVREVREEVGLDVHITRWLGYKDSIERDVAGQVKWHYIIFYFEAEALGENLKPGDDAVGARWATPAEIGGFCVTDAVPQCLEWAGINQDKGVALP